MIRFERLSGSIIPILILVVFFFLDNVCYSTEGHQAPGQLKLLIEIDKNVYSPEEEILLKCRIGNHTETTVFLYPILLHHVQIYLKHENQQQEIPLSSRFLGTQMIRKGDIIRVQPEASFVFKRSIIKELYSNAPRRIGRYQLYAVYKNRMESLEKMKAWTGELRSNALEFEIK